MVSLEVEAFLNNKPLTYYYNEDGEDCLALNHFLFGKQLKRFNPDLFEISYTLEKSRKISNTLRG